MNKAVKTKIFRHFEAFSPLLQTWKRNNDTIVFTNGCFDLIHHGHIDSLEKAAALGTKLVVGLNSDKSVQILKGKKRPILGEMERATILAAMEMVDAVIIFEEETPADIIAKIIPHVLVKGAQYEIHEIAGHDTVLNHGGSVKTLDLVDGISTSELIERIKQL